MRIDKKNKAIIKKVLNTIEVTEAYRRQIREYIGYIRNFSDKEVGKRIPSRFVVHFTNKSKAESIIRSGEILTNSKGYISLTELNPLEFKTITQSKQYGFAFIKDLLIKKYDVISPVAFSSKSSIIEELRKQISAELFEKLIKEESASEQDSILYMNQLEMRVFKSISLTDCVLFFRNSEVEEREKNKLSELGIFMLPYTLDWIINYFVHDQRWIVKEEGGLLEIYDDRKKNLTTEEAIKKLEGYS